MDRRFVRLRVRLLPSRKMLDGSPNPLRCALTKVGKLDHTNVTATGASIPRNYPRNELGFGRYKDSRSTCGKVIHRAVKPYRFNWIGSAVGIRLLRLTIT